MRHEALLEEVYETETRIYSVESIIDFDVDEPDPSVGYGGGVDLNGVEVSSVIVFDIEDGNELGRGLLEVVVPECDREGLLKGVDAAADREIPYILEDLASWEEAAREEAAEARFEARRCGDLY